MCTRSVPRRVVTLIASDSGTFTNKKINLETTRTAEEKSLGGWSQWVRVGLGQPANTFLVF